MAEENGKGKAPEGFFNSILRPLKKHRVTLTKAGKSALPMRKKSAKKVKETKGKAKPAAKKKPIALMSQRERQVNELKTLANIGKRDPERLAAIITRMLMDEDEMKERERLRYERMIWKRAEKYGQPPPEESGEKGAE